MVDFYRWSNSVKSVELSKLESDFVVSNGIFRIFCDDKLLFDIKLSGFEQGLGLNRSVLVCFNAAVPKRSERVPPFFSGENIAKELDLPLISIADPTIYQSKKLSLAWYTGSSENAELPQRIAYLLSVLQYKYGLRFCLFGGSGGGFASLNVVSLLNFEASAVVWNPQVCISKYNVGPINRYAKVAFGCRERLTPSSAYNFFESKGIRHTLLKSAFSRLSNVFYMQNYSDSKHRDDHALPFVRLNALPQVNECTFANDKLGVFFGDWGVGHIVPPREVVVFSIRKSFLSGALAETLQFSSGFAYKGVNL